MRSEFKSLSLSLIYLLSACGQGSKLPIQADSSISSLVGGINGRCPNFSAPPRGSSSSFHCGSFTYFSYSGKADTQKEAIFEIRGFDAGQVDIIKRGIDMAMNDIQNYYYESNFEKRRPTQFETCVNKYAQSSFVPDGFANSGQDAIFYAGLAMNTINILTSYHENNDIYALIDAYDNPVANNTGRAFVGKSAANVGATQDMNITINRNSFNVGWFNPVRVYASTIFQEWLHRGGFMHPVGGYVGPLISEADQCLARGNLDKTGLSGVEPYLPD